MEPFDLAILGSGSTAFSAAIRAAHLGKTVAMTESRTLGGTCVKTTGSRSSMARRASSVRRHSPSTGGASKRGASWSPRARSRPCRPSTGSTGYRTSRAICSPPARGRN